MDDKLEPEFAPHFHAWKAKPSPQTAGTLLREVHPVLHKAISAHVGKGDPLLTSRARRIALDAFTTYDPSRAKLATHLTNQLQGLKRQARQQRQIISLPERVALDRSHLQRQHEELSDRLGREPSLVELADHTGLSVSRIKHVQRFRPPVAEGMLDRGEESEGFAPAVLSPASQSWLHFVYHDAHPTDQKILEWSLGLHGVRRLSNQEIARRLRLSPGAVSQRKKQLQRRLDEADRYSPFR